MKELTHLSLFSGIGGLDLAAEWAGFKTVGQCEWADYPTKVLEKHWPDVPRWKDIRTLTGESFYERTGLRTVDVISGGFPCQPFSVAGKQRGKEDDRYLWPEMVRVIKELRPTWVVGENVAGIIRMALPDILSELEACGYRTRTFLIPACAVGARHRRYRVAIVGYAEHNGLSATAVTGSIKKTGRGQQERQEAPRKLTRTGEPGNSEDVANTKSARDRKLPDVQYSDGAGRKEQHLSEEPDREEFPCRGCDEGKVCNTTGKGLPDGTVQPMGGQGASEPESQRPDSYVSNSESGREQQYIGIRTETRRPSSDSGRPTQSRLGGMADGLPDWVDGYWDVEPDIPRVTTGIPHRVEKLKGLGNAVVPPQFYPVFKSIYEVEYMIQTGQLRFA